MKRRFIALAMAAFVLAACGASQEEQQLSERLEAIFAVTDLDEVPRSGYGFVTRSNPCGNTHTYSQDLFTQNADNLPEGHPLSTAEKILDHIEPDAVRVQLFEMYSYVDDTTVVSRQINWTTEDSTNFIILSTERNVNVRLVDYSERPDSCPDPSLFDSSGNFIRVESFSN